MRKRNFHRWALATALCAIGGLPAVPALAASSGNLIVGGDGESATCTTDWSAATTVPGWSVIEGSPSVVCYSIGTFATPSGAAAGGAFLAEGPYGSSALQQTVNVASASSAIDTGTVSFALSGWLGGYSNNNGQAVVTAVFLDAQGKPLGSPAQLSGGTASARGNRTGFVASAASGEVPAGTRSIAVRVQFIDNSLTYNISYADNLSLTLSTPVATAALQAPVSQVPAFDHVFIVMMENTNYAQVIGDTTDAPYMNSLAAMGTLLDNYSGVYHPSDENYLAIAGGNTFVKGAIYYPNIHVAATNIADEVEAAGKSWKAYEQGMGTPCNTSTQYDKYYEPDDAPLFNFTDVASNATRCAAHLFDTTQLTTDLKSAATTPNFAWIAADDYYDGEASGNGSATSLQTQDGWLKQTLQPIIASPAWTAGRSLIVLTWDESSSSTGNHLATILVGSQGLVRSGAVSNASYNHYSTGRTIESALGLPPMTANDRYAQPINDAFVATAGTAAASLTTLMPSISKGTFITFDYATPAAKLNAQNWVGIYPAGVTPGSQSSISYQYVVNAAGTVTFDTSGLAPGSYEAWYEYDNGYTALASPVAFTVSP